MARRKKSTAKRRASQAQQRATGAITTVRARVVGSVRDYVKAVESLLDWLEREIDRLLHEAAKQLETLEERGKEARKRLTAPYRKQAARLVARLEEGIADVAPGLMAPRAKPMRRKRAKKRATKKKA
jgi:DNA repair exonuclease SbcCD ATPase subunit